jgi:iron complex outermembrane receptor protein
MAAPLAAQTTPEDTLSYEVDEMVITGTRTYRKIIDVPYSIERIDNLQFVHDRKTAVDNVLGGIPGLFMQSRYGNHDVRISIRGFGSRSNTGIRGVRILLDGIPESEPDGQTRIEAIDFQSIGSIEVVKGNSSSLYTNAPGGVINFLNDLSFPRSMVMSFNEAGSFGLRDNGMKVGVRTDATTFLFTYKYHQAVGFRPHSEDAWNVANTVLETRTGPQTRLTLYGYFADGIIRVPGSLTAAQFAADPFQANRRDVARDARRYTRKGRLGVQFTGTFGPDQEHEVEFTGYGTMKFFDRTARTFRIFNRNGVGMSARYVYRSTLAGLPNEFSAGGDAFTQTGPIEEYENIGGTKGDNLFSLSDEGIGNAGFYLQNNLTVVENLQVLLTGRLDNVVFSSADQLLGVRNSTRSFSRFTPKAALNYKIAPTVAIYGSAGLGFDTPAGNELDNYPSSSSPNLTLNPDLMPQKSTNMELGMKGNLLFPETELFRLVYFDVTLFHSIIQDEIVPFDVFGDVYFRNAAETKRTGLEAGGSTEVVRGLTVRLAYTWSRFRYSSYAAGAVEVDTAGNFVTVDSRFEGNVVPSVPGDNLVAGFTYTRPLTEHLSASLKATYQYVGSMYTDDANSERTGVYQLVGAGLGADVRLGSFTALFSIGVNNLFDKRYAGFVNINSTAGEFYEAGEPRTVYGGINLGYQF